MIQNFQDNKENKPLLTNMNDPTIEPYVIFNYSIRSPQTKDSYFRRLRTFFEYAKIEGDSFREKCNNFVDLGHQYPNQAIKLIFEFLQFQKQRLEAKDITSGTLKNYQKTIKSYCEMTDVLVPRKKIIRGLPRGKRFADDRVPTLEKIQKTKKQLDKHHNEIIGVYTGWKNIKFPELDFYTFDPSYLNIILFKENQFSFLFLGYFQSERMIWHTL